MSEASPVVETSRFPYNGAEVMTRKTEVSSLMTAVIYGSIAIFVVIVGLTIYVTNKAYSRKDNDVDL
jgi:hypothetical protein